ncbi:MAG: sodium-dependent transporter [Gammaproteobacteria bacterium]|nr:sodium-dependent transporter [Gammaproteobacteria bacterium]
MAQKEIFSSGFVAVLTMIGVAVGLGNVWRFPYMMGEYGGSAFLVVYLLFTLLLGIPAMTAEWSLGRKTRKGPIGALSKVWGQTWGRRIGGLLVFTMVVSTSYYIVVIGNIAFTATYSVIAGFSDSTLQEFDTQFANGWLQYGYALGVLGFALFVLHRGLHKGIEAVSRLFVPFFALVILYLVVNALFLPGAPEKFAAFLQPDFSVLEAEHIFAALGQAFFSLGLAGTIMVIYGSYIEPGQNLARAAGMTALGDVGAAFLASLFIVPTILVFNLDLAQGPTLIFSTLPKLFSVMPGGRILGSGFLLALSLIAFLSAIGALEAIVGSISEEMQIDTARSRVIFAILVIEAAVMLPSALNPEIVGTLDLIFGSAMQMFGSTIAVITVTWGLGRITTKLQIFGDHEAAWHDSYFAWLKWVVPVVMAAVLGGYVISNL